MLSIRAFGRRVSGLIWVQNVRKCYQQTTKVVPCGERVTLISLAKNASENVVCLSNPLHIFANSID